MSQRSTRVQFHRHSTRQTDAIVSQRISQRRADRISHRARQRIRQRRHRERIRRDRVRHADGAALRPHWVVVSDHDVSAGFPGVFWWRLA